MASHSLQPVSRAVAVVSLVVPATRIHRYAAVPTFAFNTITIRKLVSAMCVAVYGWDACGPSRRRPRSGIYITITILI